MALNPRQKYLIADTRQIFTVSRELYPRIEITILDTKSKHVFLATKLENALKDGKIKKLNAKPKPKTAITNDFFIKYRIERELCYLNEGKPNIYEQLIKELK